MMDKKDVLSTNFYISDTHFGHANIIRYDNRPFKNTEEMDRELIDRWNETVGDNDTVYILGDFSWHKEDGTIKVLDELAGNKVLIKGNHDRVSPQIAKRFIKVCDYLEIKDGDENVVMSHYPILFWNRQFYDSVHLYGHVHNSHQWNFCKSWQQELKEIQSIPMRMFNVGCMIPEIDYTPRTLQEILGRCLP